MLYVDEPISLNDLWVVEVSNFFLDREVFTGII